ncbi:chloride channel protein [Devosia sp.]|uniref:chloride channel protein n=1 Tax=Devosia sp. TaxID=1871048 RepID=UPI003A8E91A2
MTQRTAQPQTVAEEAGDTPEKGLSLLTLSLLALGLGIFTGFGALIFRLLINFVHNVFFNGSFNLEYDADSFTDPSRWGWLIIFAPVIGGLVVTWLVSNFAPEAKGHGVPEVMDAIYYKEGKIRPVVALVKSVASAFAIGSGSSVGREGPIIQIGSALGSTLGQIVKMPVGQRIALVAAGAGAGIASTFNTPIGGVMFAIELMLPEVSVVTFLPVAISTGAATFVGHWFFGDAPAFSVPPIEAINSEPSAIVLLVLYALMGGVVGAAAAGFIRLLHFAEDNFDRIGNRYLRHSIGMLMVGIMMYVLMVSFGQYYVDGVGYGTIGSVLNDETNMVWLLLLLFACKAVATSLSLGSGSSGGIFSPSLFMGATLGGGFAAALNAVGFPIELSVPAFAMIGMGAMVGGGTGAVMTAVAMTFEMTRDYNIVMPMILAVATSVGVRRLLLFENIYTIKLVRRGRSIPKALHSNMFLVKHAREVMDKDVLVLPAESSFDAFLREHEAEGRLRYVVVVKGDQLFGVIRVNTGLRRGLESTETGVTLGDVASRDFTIVGEEFVASDIIERMWRKNAIMAVVVSGHGVPRAADVAGVITREHVANSVAEGLKIYPR